MNKIKPPYYNKLSEAVAFTAGYFLKMSQDQPQDFQEFFDRICQEPEDWNTRDGWHSTGGMAFRNFLRSHGYSEETLRVRNLDDWYAEIIALAVDAVARCKYYPEELPDVLHELSEILYRSEFEVIYRESERYYAECE